MPASVPVNSSKNAVSSDHGSRITNNEHRSFDRPARPFSVTIFALLVLSIAGINLIRFVQALVEWQFWAATLPVSPVYLALSGLVWTLTWAPLAWGLWQGYSWAHTFTLPAAGAFALYYWLDRLFLKGGAGSSSLPVAVLLTLVFLLYARWMLNRPQARDFFIRDLPGETHDR
jgi:hypothetical protein